MTLSERLSLRPAVMYKLLKISDDPIISSADEDGAKELGISLQKYLEWKEGFRLTYVVAGAVPIESEKNTDTRLYAENPSLTRPLPRFFRNVYSPKWKGQRSRRV